MYKLFDTYIILHWYKYCHTYCVYSAVKVVYIYQLVNTYILVNINILYQTHVNNIIFYVIVYSVVYW